MNIMDMLQQSGGIGTMAKELGVNESVAQAGAAALLPAGRCDDGGRIYGQGKLGQRR